MENVPPGDEDGARQSSLRTSVESGTMEAPVTPETQDSTTSQPSPPSAGHRRTLSGSILSRLSFLRSASTVDPAQDLIQTLNPVSPPPEPAEQARQDEDAIPKHRGGGAVAAAVRQSKGPGRKRKGSLRKTALLGTGGKVKMDGRERKNSNLDPYGAARRAIEEQHYDAPLGRRGGEFSRDSVEEDPTTPRGYHHGPLYTDSSTTSTTWDKLPPLDTSSGNDYPHSHGHSQLPPPLLASPPSNPYASTTDDDESLTFSRPATTLTTSLQRRRSARDKSTAHTSHPAPPIVSLTSPSEDEWDSSTTEWWGWLILLTTWLVFVVGMGSCLGVWSWAWDVGETPYAPPELEDDPTLPIVGYYPALIVMTAVMAWVWVVVAWMGMKYFRHAKVVGDE